MTEAHNPPPGGARDILLERSRGVLPPSARERLGAATVLVVGCGGIGGALAHELARSGLASLVLVDFDRYEATNANRQLDCYTPNLGLAKVEVLARSLGSIPGGPAVTALAERGNLPGLAVSIARADFVVAAADDYALSLALLDAALDAGKPCGFALPLGLWAGVAVFVPGGPRPSRLFGLAPADEAGYRACVRKRLPRFARWVRQRSGGAATPEYEAFTEGRLPPPQLCPTVWTAASLLALETLKIVGGIGRPILAPRWQEVGGAGTRTRFSLASALGLLLDRPRLPAARGAR
jgi:molybdopterin/thiamine biosynthesis adenylyltransferase